VASASDITLVRQNTGEPVNVEPFTDEYIGGLIDTASVAGASAVIWSQKAVKASTLVDVSEAGASHKFSDVFKNATAMRDYWNGLRNDELTPTSDVGRVVVRKIIRT
jgi:hypothetical protein